MIPYYYYDSIVMMHTIDKERIPMTRSNIYSLMSMKKLDVCKMCNVRFKELTRCCEFFGIYRWGRQRPVTPQTQEERIRAYFRQIDRYNTEILIQELEQESNVHEYLEQVMNDNTILQKNTEPSD